MKFKRKKANRFRGSHTHGWGAKKKHRGSGSRGGKGNAGSGKRGDQKKPSYWKEKNWEGKHGFTSKSRTKIIPINIKDIEQKLNNYLKENLIKKTADAYEIDLKELGFNKLLSSGKPTHKFIIKTQLATERAIDKIRKAGGEVKLIVPKIKKNAKPEETTKESIKE